MPRSPSPSPAPQAASRDVKPTLSRKRTKSVPDSHQSALTPDEDIKPQPTKRRRATDSDTPGRPSTAGSTVRGAWTGDEYVQLFDHVMAHGTGAKSFAVAVPGRSGNQAAMAWRDVVRPKCREMLFAKGKRAH